MVQRFTDDVIFDVADIHGEFPTAFLKLPGTFEYLKSRQDQLEEEQARRDGEKRYSPGVYQPRLNPPCYQIWLNFQPVRRLVYELDLDRPGPQTFFSKLIAGGDYAWALDKKIYRRYQKYTVEVFGPLMTHLPTANIKHLQLPDPRQYATPPKYWYESPLELVQIWRTRIFRSVPELFTPSLTNPLTPFRPNFPCLEERWHPDLTRLEIDFLSFDKSTGPPSKHSEFLADAYRILMRAPTTLGRPRRYELKEFYCEARKVYRQLSAKGNRPSRKEIALRMNLSRSSFRRYWAKTKIPWEDAHETFKSDVIPPQILDEQFYP